MLTVGELFGDVIKNSSTLLLTNELNSRGYDVTPKESPKSENKI